MARTIWVKVTDPKGLFYQDIVDETTGEIRGETVRAETIDGRQVPVPVEVEYTPEVAKALSERAANQPIGGTRTRLVECTPAEVDAHLGRQISAPAPSGETSASSGASKPKPKPSSAEA